MTTPTQASREAADRILRIARWEAALGDRSIADIIQAASDANNAATWNAAIDAALLEIPGGQSCDPQDVADLIRDLKK